MKAVICVALLLAVAGGAAAQTPAALAPASTGPNGTKFWKDPLVAAKANNLTAFASNVEGAGLGPKLGVSDLVATVFAPSNAAFEAFKASTDPAVQAILDDKDKLVAVLQYHVIPGATIGSARVKSMIKGTKNGVLPYKSLEGEKVNATLEGDSILVNNVPVTGADVQGGKTMIHTISEVLIPPSLLAGGAAPAPVATKDVPVETKGAPAVTNGAASVAAGLLLAVPAAIAALL